MKVLSSTDHLHLSWRSKAKTRRPLSAEVLRRQNLAFQGTAGTSAGSRSQGFTPAFLDTETGAIHLACYADGRPAPIHVFDGLPQECVISRSDDGKCLAVKHSIIVGFVRRGIFYTREQAACCA